MDNRGTVEELDNASDAVKWMLSGGNANMISWENVAVSLGVIRKQHAELVDVLEHLLADAIAHGYSGGSIDRGNAILDKVRGQEEPA